MKNHENKNKAAGSMNRVMNETTKILKGRKGLVKRDPDTGNPVWTNQFLDQLKVDWEKLGSVYLGELAYQQIRDVDIPSGEMWTWVAALTRMIERVVVVGEYIKIELPEVAATWEEEDFLPQIVDTMQIRDHEGNTVPIPTTEEKETFFDGTKLQEPFFRYILGYGDPIVEMSDSFLPIRDEIEGMIRLETEVEAVGDLLWDLAMYTDRYIYFYLAPRISRPELFPNDDLEKNHQMVASFGWVFFDVPELKKLRQLSIEEDSKAA